MFTEGIFPIGDGLLDIDEKRLKGLLVPDDINEIYDVEQTPFARGKFAAVRRAIHKNSGVHFAAKFLKRRRRAQSSDKEIKHEIAVLMLCEGEENIVKLNAVHESRSDTALLLELATGGELQTFLDNEECLSEAHARICMREVLKALQFLHKRSIAHLDLKPQNILLTGERIEDGLKLCDFGISRVVAEGTNVREIVGTPDYVAPEVLQYEPLSLLTDIWSVGVLAYVLLSGFSPFGGETKQETFLNISQCALTFPDKLFGGTSAAAIDFIRQALRIKPNERMTAAGCLEHCWLKDECSLDRQIFNSLAKQTNVNVDELDVDAADEEADDEAQDISIDEDDDDDDDDDENVDEDDGIVDNVVGQQDNDDDAIATDDNNQTIGCKMDSSDTETDLFTTKNTTNTTHTINQLTNGKCTNGIAPTSATTTASPKCTKSATATRPAIAAKPTTTTTAILTLPPATRATTIPLYNVHAQQHHIHHHPHPHLHQLQQQQQPYITARRQSSDSNKENTYLATKKIATANLIKKPIHTTSVTTPSAAATTTTTTSTATIIIAPSDTPMNGTDGGNIVATITLPNGSVERNKQQQQQQHKQQSAHCLFPDAPTTPKVIRKAPTTDTSPTSVKALVKKFQLESKQAEKHLKETQLNQQQQQLEQEHESACNVTTNCSNRRSSTNTIPTINGKTTKNDKIEKNPKHTKFMNSNNSNKETTVAVTSTRLISNARRASEPITAVHKKSTTTTTSVALAGRHSVAATPTAAATPNFKSTCVFGISCNGRSNGVTTTTTTSANECRHSSNNTNNNNKTAVSGTSPATATVANGSTPTAAALLLSSHQQLQQHHQLQHQHPHPHHHHHHHHVHHHVAKNTANNLSMDQGIIC